MDAGELRGDPLSADVVLIADRDDPRASYSRSAEVYAPPPSIDDTWPLWVLGITLASGGIWLLAGRLMRPLAVARVAAILVAVAGVLLYAWLVYEDLVAAPTHLVASVNLANRVESLLESTVYILVPALAPLYLLRRTARPEARRLAAVFGVVVTVGTFVLGAVAFFLLAWASKVGQRGTAMLAIQAPLGFLAVTGITLARSAWRAARE